MHRARTQHTLFRYISLRSFNDGLATTLRLSILRPGALKRQLDGPCTDSPCTDRPVIHAALSYVDPVSQSRRCHPLRPPTPHTPPALVSPVPPAIELDK
ncbi:hypothetical protein SJAG_03171 [Schizosaccharomyces japonicus yFS275]|uniref:Uncharacterized protein n=1 Tax=Schizosaccharomyces japonicus (strain yFS275 / FY16936) TaxID=402676 RepID=B6K3I6_SCHJY|nr:hypothetical protein SJAG_03171 [Schizosaccharomyces japonicus yFS275]EEB08043.1 hypothetical protein SJAG_03171 [Schizosaccharomyces japonicus yFS275]